MALKGKVATALLSHQGMVRTNNEDAVGEVEEFGLLILADGMGGYNAGEIASGIAVTTVRDMVKQEWPKLQAGALDERSGYSVEALLLKHAVETAHSTIHQVSQTQPQCAGMGTTIVTCLIHDDRLSIAYVGDSRLYRLRKGKLEQVTRDHSLTRRAGRPRTLHARGSQKAGAQEYRYARTGGRSGGPGGPDRRPGRSRAMCWRSVPTGSATWSRTRSSA